MPNCRAPIVEAALSEPNAVPLIVLSAARDPVEAVNSTLRRAGHPVHCTWIPALRDLGDALAQINPELLLQVAGTPAELGPVIGLRDQLAPTVPVLLLAPSVDEALIAGAIERGARDAVTLGNQSRLTAVVLRELAVFRAARALDVTQRSAHDARSQLDHVLQRSNDAILQVQEGIVIDANPAWHELYGVEDGLAGQPVMDLFEESTHAALRGALAACQQGRWSDHLLRANALLGDGTVLPIEITLASGEHDGEPCVRLVVPARQRVEELVIPVAAAPLRPEPAAGLLRRPELLEALAERLATPVAGGMRCMALVRIDKFAALERVIGITASEEVVAEVARLLKETLHPKEIAGRFGGVRFLALLERGNEQDITAWTERLLARVQRHVMRINDKSIAVTCTIGLSMAPGNPQLDAVVQDAIECARRGSARGGNQSVASERADNDSRVMSYDKVWVKHIKAALMENRFRLVQQPIASLQGDDPGMFDVLVRMIDQQGKEVLPSEFMAAAGRNDLLKNIDRWVVGASLSFAAQKKPECLFVRLSRETVRDGAFLEWLDNHLKNSRAEPQRLCFQVNEESASIHVNEVKKLTAALRERRFRFALEGFGSGRNSAGMLESLPLDFVKIDGTLVQGLAGDPELQQRVKLLVEAARKQHIQTIAERVEDANTMAVLWQIGVQYIQGYFINEPEEVVLRAER
jgi:diguanylate cyclase (GGDEF)-like protein